MTGLVKAMTSGFVATKVMTKVMYDIAPMLGLARVDVAGAIDTPGKRSKGDSEDHHDKEWDKEKKQPGMSVHYLLGTVIFPLSYNMVFRFLLPGNSITKGMLWGAGLWGVGQSTVFPLLGKEPLFREKKSAGITYFIVHMIYGIVFCAGAEMGNERR